MSEKRCIKCKKTLPSKRFAIKNRGLCSDCLREIGQGTGAALATIAAVGLAFLGIKNNKDK